MSDHAEHGHAEAHAPAATPAHAPAATPAHAPAATPAHAPAATPAHAPAATSAPATGQRPISRFIDMLSSSGSTVVASTAAFGGKLRTVLRAGELEPVEQQSLLKTPFYAAGHVLDGTILNAARRAVEVAEPAISGLRAIFRSTIGTVLHPLRSLMHPIETVKNPLRIITSTAMMTKNAIMATPRAIHEAVDRGIDRTREQLSKQFERIPAVGPLLATPVRWITGLVNKAVAGVTNFADFLTSPVDLAHNSVAPA